MNGRIWVGSFVAILLNYTGVFAADTPTMMDAAEARHRDALAGTLNLSDAQSKAFWPVYAAYQKEMNEAFEGVAEVAYRVYDHSGPVTDAMADEYTESLLRGDSKQAAINLAYQGRFRKILDSKKTTRLFQFERRFRSAISMELANEIPLLK